MELPVIKPFHSCAIGGCGLKSKINCPSCIQYIPGRNSKYHRCMRYLENRMVCPLDKSQCKTCSYHIPVGARGKPNETGIEWSDPQAKQEYLKLLRKKKHGKNN